MRIKVLQENLIKAIQDANRCIASKPQIPILSNILLEAKEGRLHCSATDLALGMHLSIGCKVEEEGVAAVSGRLLMEVLSSLQAGSLDVFVENRKLYIQGSRSKAELQTVDSQEFPPFPQKQGEGFQIQTSEFLQLIQLGGLASGIDETRPVFSSMLFELEEGEFAVVATDGYRLSRNAVQISLKISKKILLSAKSLKEIARMIEKTAAKTVEITLSEEVGQVFFGFGESEVMLRMSEGDYPAYRTILPKEKTLQIEVGAQELAGAVKSAMVFSKEVSGIIHLNISKDEVNVSSVSASGKSENGVDCKIIEGEAGEIAFNGKYVQDFLQFAGDSQVEFSMLETLKPGTFTLPQKENFYYVIMPFRVQS